MKWSIVVTDGEQRAALATVRSLGRAGHQVHVCALRRRSLAGASRFCASEHVVADALSQPDAFATDVERTCAAVRADVLLPVSEASLLAILPHRERFRVALPFPSLSSFLAVCDKELVLRLAAAHGIATPRQLLVSSREDLPGSGDALTFPVVLKPSRSVVGAAGQRKKVGVVYAEDRRELERRLEESAPEVYPILLQERIEGQGFAISFLIWNGDVRAAFAHRRLREKPPSGGVSVLRDSIPLDAEVLQRSAALLAAFSWQGVAMVEFKRDHRSGTPYLMEINGRLWGSLQLAIDAGVDFPRLLVEAAMGMHSAPVLDYPAGVRTRWELGDLDHLLLLLRHSAAELHLPSGAPGRLATLRGFLGSLGPSTRGEVLKLDDPRPFFREAIDWLARR